MIKKYDFLIIGGGIAGYSSALKLSSYMKVAIIENKKIGGVCLNKGCIPTKSYRWLASRWGEAAFQRRSDDEKQEIFSDEGKKRAETYIADVVGKLRSGLESVISSAGIDVIYGEAVSAQNNNQIVVKKLDGNDCILEFHWLLIATGSQPMIPKVCNPLYNAKITGKNIFSSDAAFERDNIMPESILIIGGGVIGAEFASIYSKFGSKVTLVEQQERIIANFSKDISRAATRLLRNMGVRVLTGWSVADIQDEDDETVVTVEKNRDGMDGANQKEEMIVNKILTAVGRTPIINTSLMDGLSVKYEKNRVCVNEFYETSNRQVYAAGDVCSGIQLAYIASLQGERVADRVISQMKGKGCPARAERTAVPGLEDEFAQTGEQNIPICVFTDPEIAQIGICEDSIDLAGESYKISKYPLKGNGMAVLQNSADGYVKLIAEAGSGIIVGAELVCPDAVEIVMLCKAWIENRVTGEDIAHMVFPHPSISEALKEAAKRLL